MYVKTNFPRPRAKNLSTNVIRNMFIKIVWKHVANAHAKISGIRRPAKKI